MLTVIENNKWGMGTRVDRAIATPKIAETQAPSYGMKGYTINGMDYFNCYTAFKEIAKDVAKGHPVLVECICERFKGHSVSDPGLYRTKEELSKAMKRDPILFLGHALEKQKILTKKEIEEIDKEAKSQIMEALKFAEESPEPPLSSLEEGVYADD